MKILYTGSLDFFFIWVGVGWWGVWGGGGGELNPALRVRDQISKVKVKPHIYEHFQRRMMMNCFFLRNGGLMKCFKPYFQLRPLSEILSIAIL